MAHLWTKDGNVVLGDKSESGYCFMMHSVAVDFTMEDKKNSDPRAPSLELALIALFEHAVNLV